MTLFDNCCSDIETNHARQASTMSTAAEVLDLIVRSVSELRISGKMGKSHLQPIIASALRTAGFVADEEDDARILPSGIPVWRSKDNHAVVETIVRRRVDIVVYRDGQLAAMIETESSLGDLRVSGVTRRNGHYDVESIAKNADGGYFDSYKSLERMATAAFSWSIFCKTGAHPLPQQAQALLEAIRSDDSTLHNPENVPLFLVSGLCRNIDEPILSRRIKSLSATLVCVNDAYKSYAEI